MSASTKPRRRALLLWAAAAVGLPAVTYTGVESTSGPAFCDSCHEITPAVASWRSSEHGPTPDGERADCRDCHVPAWSNPAATVWVKTRHGVRDLYYHLTREPAPDFYLRTKERALGDVTDAVCLDCHAEILGAKDVLEDELGSIRGLHTSDEAKRLRCIVCHKNTGHGPFE